MAAEVIRCVVCDKPVKHSGPMVVMSTRGFVYAEDHAGKVPASQDQGWWEIGPDCLKKVQRAGPQGLELRSAR